MQSGTHALLMRNCGKTVIENFALLFVIDINYDPKAL